MPISPRGKVKLLNSRQSKQHVFPSENSLCWLRNREMMLRFYAIERDRAIH